MNLKPIGSGVQTLYVCFAVCLVMILFPTRNWIWQHIEDASKINMESLLDQADGAYALIRTYQLAEIEDFACMC